MSSNTSSIGANLQGGSEDSRKEAARLMGRARTERKVVSGRENMAKARLRLADEDVRAKLREAQKARRERELAERVASGIVETTEKKPVGRPRKQADPQAEATPKRGRGRPKKQTGETLPMDIEGA